MGYVATDNEDIVKKVTDQEIDLSDLIAEYISLKAQYLDRPQPKTVPDQETLELYNMDIEGLNAYLMDQIRSLYLKFKPIKEAGLLPSKYDDEYTQLGTLVNN